jgi:hypothetical protein
LEKWKRGTGNAKSPYCHKRDRGHIFKQFLNILSRENLLPDSSIFPDCYTINAEDARGKPFALFLRTSLTVLNSRYLIEVNT